MAQVDIDTANADFWNNLCGTIFAQSLGITDRTADSLRKFDEAYLALYPYLLKYVPLAEMRGKRVLEVGLGYGTVAQCIASAGADYTGLDIAAGPVGMVNHRLHMANLPGRALQGSILNPPIESGSMDWVVAVGCYHHTGNMQKAVDETYRLLKPGGHAMVMVYNRFAYRLWRQWPKSTFVAFLNEHGARLANTVTRDQRKAYDATIEGDAAPETEFFSARDAKCIFRKFSEVRTAKENADDVFIPVPRYNDQTEKYWLDGTQKPIKVNRSLVLATIGRAAGLDLYITARK